MGDLPIEGTVRRVSLRLLPLLFALYLFAYLDRTNVGMAALQMDGDLGFSPAVIGIGGGIFFFGYSLFEIPSNLVLARVGARPWIARIAVTWGLITCATVLVHTARQFYAARFLLGAAEAGLFPGVVYYLARWYPERHRSRALSAFTIAIPLAQVIGGPLGGVLLSMRGVAGLSGWQWLFLLEGLPPMILGLAALLWLTERPEDAHWLEPGARRELVRRIAREPRPAREVTTPWQALVNPLAWVLALCFFAYLTCSLSFVLWAPTIVRETLGTTDALTGLVTGGVALLGAAVMPATALLADRWGERCYVAALGLSCQALGSLGLVVLSAHSPLKLVALACFPLATAFFLPSFWTLPSRFLKGTAAAAGIALVNAVGSTGGFFGPSLVGVFRTLTGGDRGAFVALAVLALVGAVTCVLLRRLPVFRPVPEA